MYKNSSAPSNNAALWHYLGTKCLDHRYENNSTPEVLIKEVWYMERLIGESFVDLVNLLLKSSF